MSESKVVTGGHCSIPIGSEVNEIGGTPAGSIREDSGFSTSHLSSLSLASPSSIYLSFFPLHRTRDSCNNDLHYVRHFSHPITLTILLSLVFLPPIQRGGNSEGKKFRGEEIQGRRETRDKSREEEPASPL